jgi:uncharacterized protein involved in exopolysaccharide biosynthesis
VPNKDSKPADDNPIYLLPIQMQRPHETDAGFDRYWRDIAERWPLAIGAGFIAAVLGIVLTMTLPRQYRADVLLSAVGDDQSTLNIGGSLGALSGLAGLVGLGPDGGNRRNLAIATLGSKSLAAEFIREHDLVPVLFSDRWDGEKRQWKPGLFSDPPTLADAVRFFDDEIRGVSEDRKTGLITLTIEWREREAAVAWASELVQRVNSRLRNEAIAEAKASLEYLQRDARQTSLLPLQEAAYRLTEQELKRIMFANVRADYALRIIDPAVVPEEDDYVRPRPLLLIPGFALAGLTAGALLAIVVAERQRRRGLVNPQHTAQG